MTVTGAKASPKTKECVKSVNAVWTCSSPFMGWPKVYTHLFHVCYGQMLLILHELVWLCKFISRSLLIWLHDWVILSSLHHRIVHHQIFPRSSTHGGQLSVSTFWFSLAYCPFFLKLLVWIIMVRKEDTNKHRTVSLRRFALICILQHGKRHLSTKTFVSAVQLLKDRRELRVFVRSSWQKREEMSSLQ